MAAKILFVVPYPYNTAPSQRLKFEQYYKALEHAGYQIHQASFISTSFWQIIYKKGHYLKKATFTIAAYWSRYILLSKIKKFDIVYVHLWGTPFGLPLYEMLLRKLAKKMVYDIDDLVYKASASPNNRSVRFLKTNTKVNYLMKHADHTLVSTDKLWQYTSKFTHKLSLIPATIDLTEYRHVKALNKARVIIGWSGSHTTSKYLHLLDKVLLRLSKVHSITICVMGDADFAIDGIDVDLVKWTAETEAANLQRFDIGLHPLPNEEWVYGKSGGKLVQYMAAGIPVVASAIGPNFKAVKDGYNGFLAATEDEWFDKLSVLITRGDLRRQMGANSRTFAEQHYSVEANLHKYISVFTGL